MYVNDKTFFFQLLKQFTLLSIILFITNFLPPSEKKAGLMHPYLANFDL